MLPYSLILAMTVMGSVASLFLKEASGSLKGDNIVQIFLNLMKNSSLYLGAFLYVAAALLNIYVLGVMDYSRVLPLTAFTYVWTMFFARIRLKEPFSVRKIVGVCLVVLGAVLVSRT